MSRKRLNLILIGAVLLLLLAGCGPLEQRLADGTSVAAGLQIGTPLSADVDGLLVRTIVVDDGSGGGPDETVVLTDLDLLATRIQAELDAVAQDTPQPSNTVVPSPALPTATEGPQFTATLSEDDIKLTSLAETLAVLGTGTSTPTEGPTATLTPTHDGPTFTPAPTEVPCLAMRFVAHVTYPPDSIVQPSFSFFKSWQVQNVGTCTWNGDYSLVWYDGFQLNGTTPLRFGGNVAVPPGDYVTLTIQLWTPPQSGTYTSLWMLSDNNGNVFGGGSEQNVPLLVRVVVPGTSPPEFTQPVSTPPPFYTNTPGP